MRSQYSFQNSESTQRLLARLSGDDQNSVAQEISTALGTSLETQLSQAGYLWNPNLDKQAIGDLQVTLIQLLPESGATPGAPHPARQAIQPLLVLPTATELDPTDLFGLKAGERRWGLGFKYAYERRLTSRWQFNGAATGTYFFSSTQARRLPSEVSDELKEWLDPQAQVSGGARVLGQAQLRHVWPQWLGVNVGLTYQHRFVESIEGQKFAAAHYDWASERTASRLLSAYASIDLNSVQSFIEGQFIFPALAELGVGLPLAGANALAEPVLQLQGSLFF